MARPTKRASDSSDPFSPPCARNSKRIRRARTTSSRNDALDTGSCASRNLREINFGPSSTTDEENRSHHQALPAGRSERSPDRGGHLGHDRDRSERVRSNRRQKGGALG